MFTIALVFAMQLPPQTVERVTEEVDRRPRFAGTDDARARAVSMFDVDTFALLPGAPLAGFDAVFIASVERPADVEARGLPVFKKSPGGARDCVASMTIEARSAAHEVVIDWSKAAFVNKGVARAAVPGFTRKMTAGLAQRPSSAPPGAAIFEEVFAVDALDGECISSGEDLVLDVPVRVGGREDRARFIVKKDPLPATEAEVFALVEPPPVRWAPPDAATSSFPLATVVGGAAGFVGGSALGLLPVFMRTAPDPIASSVLGVGLCGGGFGAAGAGAGWLLVDASADAKAKENEALVAGAKADTARRSAWMRRRLELGLTKAP